MSGAPAAAVRFGRLRTRGEFREVMTRGARASAGAVTVYALRRPDEGVKVGVSVGRKIGGSVKRNRVRRRLKEALRRVTGDVRGVDLVVVAREDKDFQKMVEALREIFQDLGLGRGPAH